MYLPLTPPKPERRACPRWRTGAAQTVLMLLSACTLITLRWGYYLPPKDVQDIACDLSRPVIERSVPMVTVTTTTTDVAGDCILITHDTQEMPLMELYDELCEMERRTERDDRSDKENEQDFARQEKAFAARYGLTLQVVQQIKAQGRTWYKADHH
jgi:hypothetical protein